MSSIDPGPDPAASHSRCLLVLHTRPCPDMVSELGRDFGLPLTVCEPGPTAWSRAVTTPYQLIVLALRVESAADRELVRELTALTRSPVVVLADFGSPRVEAEL